MCVYTDESKKTKQKINRNQGGETMFSVLKIGAFWCLLSGVVVYSFCSKDDHVCDFQEYKDKIEKLETELDNRTEYFFSDWFYK